MSQFAFILFCLAVGVFLRKREKVPENAHETLGTFIIYLSLPALTILNLHRLEFTASLLLPILMPWAQIVLAWLLFSALARRFGWTGTTVGCLTLVAGLGNTSFLGLPMLEVLIGREALPVVNLLDQLGTFLALSTIGIAVAARYSEGRTQGRHLVKKVLTFPPFLAMLAAFALRPFPIPEFAVKPLELLASTLTPLALVTVGLQLSFSGERLRHMRRELSAGLAFKLVISPLIFWGISRFLGNADSLAARVTVLEAAMAPMISASIVASQFGLRPELSASMVGLGAVLSLVSVPLWALFV